MPKNPITKHHSYVSGYVFANTSDSLEIILKHLNNYNKEANTIPIIAKNLEDSTLLLFYLILMQYLNSTIISPADLIQIR